MRFTLHTSRRKDIRMNICGRSFQPFRSSCASPGAYSRAWDSAPQIQPHHSSAAPCSLRFPIPRGSSTDSRSTISVRRPPRSWRPRSPYYRAAPRPCGSHHTTNHSSRTVRTRACGPVRVSGGSGRRCGLRSRARSGPMGSFLLGSLRGGCSFRRICVLGEIS